jgi:AcrR family transcriptional regulator
MKGGQAEKGRSKGEPLRPGRPRSTVTRDAILQAVAALLEEGGYPAVSIEAVAQRAGVGKQSIYRWWPGKADLVLEHLVAFAQTVRPPDRGSLADDLKELLTWSFRTLSGGLGPIMGALMAEAQVDRRFGKAFYDQLIAGRRQALKGLLERGRARRELPADADLDTMVDMIYGAMWYRLLLGHEKLNADFAARLIRALGIKI